MIVAILVGLIAGFLAGQITRGSGYGILMECCMLGLFPFFLRVTNKVDFIAVSMIGHLAYGAVLGGLTQRYLRF